MDLTFQATAPPSCREPLCQQERLTHVGGHHGQDRTRYPKLRSHWTVSRIWNSCGSAGYLRRVRKRGRSSSPARSALVGIADACARLAHQVSTKLAHQQALLNVGLGILKPFSPFSLSQLWDLGTHVRPTTGPLVR